MKSKRLMMPYVAWMLIFTIIPLGVVVYFAFTDSITGQFTLENLSNIGIYMPIFMRSIFLALISAAICLLIGYPVAYTIAQASPKRQRFLSMLIMLPMCMSFCCAHWPGSLCWKTPVSSILLSPPLDWNRCP